MMVMMMKLLIRTFLPRHVPILFVVIWSGTTQLMPISSLCSIPSLHIHDRPKKVHVLYSTMLLFRYLIRLTKPSPLIIISDCIRLAFLISITYTR